MTREPGDLPLIQFVAGRGASALANSVRHPGSGRLPLRSDTGDVNSAARRDRDRGRRRGCRRLRLRNLPASR